MFHPEEPCRVRGKENPGPHIRQATSYSALLPSALSCLGLGQDHKGTWAVVWPLPPASALSAPSSCGIQPQLALGVHLAACVQGPGGRGQPALPWVSLGRSVSCSHLDVLIPQSTRLDHSVWSCLWVIMMGGGKQRGCRRPTPHSNQGCCGFVLTTREDFIYLFIFLHILVPVA